MAHDPTIREKILHGEMLFCNSLNGKRKKKKKPLWWFIVTNRAELYSCETVVLTQQSLRWSWGRSALTPWPTAPTFKWYRKRCIFPALESLPASYWVLNEFLKKKNNNNNTIYKVFHNTQGLKFSPKTAFKSSRLVHPSSTSHAIIKIILKPKQLITPVNFF